MYFNKPLLLLLLSKWLLWKHLSKSYLQRRKMEKQREKGSWKLENAQSTRNLHNSCHSASSLWETRCLAKLFSLLFCFKQEKTLRNFSKTVTLYKYDKGNKGEAMPKLAQILQQSSGTRQVRCVSVFFSDHFMKQIDFMLPWVCSVIDHRRRQLNVIRTSLTHSPATRLTLGCFYQIWRHLWLKAQIYTEWKKAPNFAWL